MAVYVDNFYAPYKRMLMCHMAADTLQELHDMDVLTGDGFKPTPSL